MGVSTASTTPWRALYYPYSRTVNETTLKRAILLYDEILFADPMSSRVRAGLFDVHHHLPYLPPDAATALAEEWSLVSKRYDLLEREGLLRLVDPAGAVEDAATGQLIADALGADLADRSLRTLFSVGYPQMWSMLRTRIPGPAFKYLAHQIPSRVLSGTDPGGPTPVALYLDGHPGATPNLGGVVFPDDGRDYAALLPYVAGSSIATSTALALALSEGAVPLTDSEAHSRLLSVRMARAAAAVPSASEVTGLTPRPDGARAHKIAQVHQQVVDSAISHDDLAALSLEECLLYRERTAEERAQFRDFLRDVVRTTYAQPWSPEINDQIEERVRAARPEFSGHAKAMRDAYRSLFKRSLVGLAVSAAPAMLTTVFPVVSPLTALLFGGGPLTAILSDPVRELLTLWTKRDRATSSLAYLMDLPTASSDVS
jgi:hypothetical protein